MEIVKKRKLGAGLVFLFFIVFAETNKPAKVSNCGQLLIADRFLKPCLQLLMTLANFYVLFPDRFVDVYLDVDVNERILSLSSLIVNKL